MASTQQQGANANKKRQLDDKNTAQPNKKRKVAVAPPPPPIAKPKPGSAPATTTAGSVDGAAKKKKKADGEKKQATVLAQFTVQYFDLLQAVRQPDSPDTTTNSTTQRACEIKTAQVGYTEDHAKLDGLSIAQTGSFNISNKAHQFFQWLIAPISTQQFFEKYWEKRVFVIKRSAWAKAKGANATDSYYSGWWSTQQIRNLVSSGSLRYTEDMDVTLYKNGKRFTLNPCGNEVAQPELLWDLFNNMKCSIRILRPQQYSQKISTMLALLEECFGQGFGANTYLTPAGSQGFAPHWDDVEAFVLQLEGKKLWKIHAPREQSEVLNRYSSQNFTPEDVGEPIMTVWLEPGDLLYFPRGTIHQASAAPDTHSLHLTISTGQNNAWIDYFEKAMQLALTAASEEMVSLRESLPRNYDQYMGVMFSQDKTELRKEFIAKASAFADELLNKYLPAVFDEAADQMACKFLWDRQPPQSLLAPEELGISAEEWNGSDESEEPISVDGQSSAQEGKMETEGQKAESGEAEEEEESEGSKENDEVDITTQSSVKLITRSAIRLVSGEGADDICTLYHALENTSVYHETPPTKIHLPIEFADAIEALYRAYPKFTKVADLPLDTDEEKIELCKMLLEKQILMLE